MRPQLGNETSWEYQRGARFENNKNDSIFLRLGRKNVVLILRWLYEHGGRWARFHCIKSSCVSYPPTPLKLTGPLLSSGKVEYWSEQTHVHNHVKTPPERTVFDKTFLKDVYLRLTHFKVTIGRVALNVTAFLWASFVFLRRPQRQ